jgi:hypothetical protein
MYIIIIKVYERTWPNIPLVCTPELHAWHLASNAHVNYFFLSYDFYGTHLKNYVKNITFAVCIGRCWNVLS